MPTTACRTLRYSALTVAALLAAGILYTMFIYHSINIFPPPERLESLGRTYQLSNLPPFTLEEIHQRHSPSHREHYTLEHVSNLWPRTPSTNSKTTKSKAKPPPAPTSNGATNTPPTNSSAHPKTPPQKRYQPK